MSPGHGASGDGMRLLVAQTAPVPGEVTANAEQIRDTVAAGAADLVVFPELALTGYDLRGRTGEVAVPSGRPPVEGLPEDGALTVLGFVEEGPEHRLYNAAAALRGRDILALHRKIHLPTYGMFDEGRHFAAGRGPVAAFDAGGGWRIGLLVCEDLWHPALPYLLALDGADVLLVLAAAPGRGTPAESGDGPPRLFASTERWTLLARTTAFLHGVYVVLANRCGVEGGVTFAGRSLVVAPDGGILAEAAEGAEDRLEVRLRREAVRSARRPYSHLRDEDPDLVRRELERICRDLPGAGAGDGG